VKNCYWCI